MTRVKMSQADAKVIGVNGSNKLATAVILAMCDVATPRSAVKLKVTNAQLEELQMFENVWRLESIRID